MKLKTVIWLVILLIVSLAAYYVGTDDVTTTDIVVLSVSGAGLIAWLFAWKTKLTDNSSKFIKFINQKIS